MAFSFNLATDAGKVRLLIPDRTETGHLFEDDEIDAFLAMEGAVVKRAAALALETAASDQALVLKAIKLLDLQTDGPKVAASLLARAATLRAQADQEDDDPGFDIAEWTPTDFAARERLWNEALRDG